MKRTELAYIVKGTKGELYATASGGSHGFVSSVSIDSRTIPEECLFFCIIGERVDAHTFLGDVREKGCHNVVVSDVKYAEEMKQTGDMNVILVKDTTRALMDLAERYMDDWPELIKVGITGSVGKTTTKEFTYSVLATKYRTGKTRGNLNSEFGVPLTVFGFDPDIEAAVIEMGTGETGPVRELSQIVKPDISLITTVGTSHMEFFGSREKLAEEKISITKGMKDGVLIVNSDCDMLSADRVAELAGEDIEIRTVGTAGGEDYHISGITDRGIGGVSCRMDTEIDGVPESIEVTLPIVGAHNVTNAALAVAAGGALGITLSEAAAGLGSIEMNANRLDVIRGNGITIINDTYNASPESMKAGLKLLSESDAGRRVAVLGSMFELGDDYAELHASVGREAARLGIDVLVTIGSEASYIAEGAAREMMESGRTGLDIHTFMDKGEAVSVITTMINSGDVILVKASRSMGLEDVSQALKEL